MNRYYMGWMAPLSFFDSPILLKQLEARAQFPIYFNPESLHLTFEEVLIPCKAVVTAPDESAAWIAVEQVFIPSEIKRRFARLWDQTSQQRLEEFKMHHGFRCAAE